MCLQANTDSALLYCSVSFHTTCTNLLHIALSWPFNTDWGIPVHIFFCQICSMVAFLWWVPTTNHINLLYFWHGSNDCVVNILRWWVGPHPSLMWIEIWCNPAHIKTPQCLTDNKRQPKSEINVSTKFAESLINYESCYRTKKQHAAFRSD